MKLTDYLSGETILGSKWKVFNELKKKFEKEGLPENIATYKASEVLTSEKLEEVNIIAKKKGKILPAVVFFLKDEKEVELIAKYFPISVINGYEPQINKSELLIELLKLLETINGKL
jgi:hypothetical protein